jgi:hypothetical protein
VNHVHCDTDQAADGFTKFGLDMLSLVIFFFPALFACNVVNAD